MKRQDYIKKQASELKRLVDKQEKNSKRYNSGNLTHASMQKLNAEMNFTGMDIQKTKERISFALEILRPEQATEFYYPSSFHKYEGIRKELEKLKFEN